MATPALKLIYFDVMGKPAAEAIRLVLSIGNVPFEDVRLTGPQFGEAKASQQFPMGSLPVLQVNNQTVCQSKAILIYASKLAGLYPKDEFTALKVDEVSGCIDDVFQDIYGTLTIKDLQEKIGTRKELVEGKMAEKLVALNKLLENNGKKFSASDEITSADVEIYACTRRYQDLRMSTGFVVDGIPTDLLDKFPKIMSSFEAVAAHPAVVKWNAAHPFRADV
eukprot:966956-Rhodomonas_salina.2